MIIKIIKIVKILQFFKKTAFFILNGEQILTFSKKSVLKWNLGFVFKQYNFISSNLFLPKPIRGFGILSLITFSCSVSASDSLRIVSLSPATTKMLRFYGQEAQLVGISAFCDDAGKSILPVGDLFSPDIERILTLKPDYVFVSSFCRASSIKKLRELGIHTKVIQDGTVQQIIQTMREFANLFHQEKMFEQWLANFRCMPEPKAKPSALLVYGIGSTRSAGNNSFVGEILSCCHSNITKNVSSSWPTLSKEFVLAADPDIIYVLCTFQNLDGQVVKDAHYQQDKSLYALYETNPFWKNLSAVKNKNLFFLDSKPFQTPSPEILQALKSLSFGWNCFYRRTY